jgi:hypothetical protein
MIRSLAAAAVLCLTVAVHGAAATAPVPTTSGDFEGTYLVGTTSCTVKPVQMAFEATWKGSKEPRYFFYDAERSTGGQVVFVTDPDTDKLPAVSFIFSTPALDTGIFVAADGAKLKVARKR